MESEPGGEYIPQGPGDIIYHTMPVGTESIYSGMAGGLERSATKSIFAQMRVVHSTT
jgi:hypothetical protein